MILLLGGTSESAPLAEALLRAGYRVLLSTATDVPLTLPEHPRLERRQGRLDGTALAALMADRAVRIVIDATHPYAVQVREQVLEAAAALHLPCLRWERPATDFNGFPVVFADDHEQAAEIAFSDGHPVLLTTGSRHLTPYLTRARRTGIRLRVRVLPHAESRMAIERAGLAPEEVLYDRGPFSVENNREHIRQHGIGVLVSKDSGEAGGVPAKLQAAQLEHCTVVVVRRPISATPPRQFHRLAELLAALATLFPTPAAPS